MNDSYLYSLVFAVGFAAIGYMISVVRNKNKFEDLVVETISTTIDKLVLDGYIQTKGYGDDQEILKWFEREENEKG
jgi:hypothetical protein